MSLVWGRKPIPTDEARAALSALWNCVDTRCALCSGCLQIVRVALGLSDADPPPVHVPADDPIRQFKPDVRKPRPMARPRPRR